MKEFFIQKAYAVSTLLPNFDEANTNWPCDASNQTEFQKFIDQVQAGEEAFKNVISSIGMEGVEDFFGCALKTGHISFWMLKYYILFALEFLISLAGLLAILMLIVGAYFYIAGGLTDDKEKGKTVIKYALGGLVVTTVSWIAVNIILLALTN